MISKFTQNKNKPILICIVDNTEKCESGWAREINMNLSDFMIHRFGTRGFDIFIGSNEQELLNCGCIDEYYSHVVMIASGTSFRLNDRLFKAIENICTEDFYIAGHIIDRGTAYYELHHQFYIVNSKEHRELGYPIIGTEEQVSHTQIEPARSVEGVFGDDDLPLRVEPGTNTKTYSEKKHGWHIFSNGLLNNKKFIDLGDAIRLGKKYIYYEYDHVFLREMSEIYYYQFFCNNAFFPFNTDALPDYINIDKPVEQYVTVGTGLNWINNLIKFGYTENTTVIFTDINLNCLKFMESLVNEWDGVNYVDFYVQKKPFDSVKDKVNIDSYVNSWNQQWDSMDKELYQKVWSTIKKLKFKFIHIDYTSQYNFDWLEQDKNTFINLSDLFNHVPYVSTQSLKYRIACENRLLTMLKTKVPEAMLLVTSRASDGFLEDKKERFDKVKNFTPTDINLLKKPEWHKKDWISLRPLT